MSSRHCIEKILEKQHSPTLSRKPTSNERIEITRASKSKFPGNFLMHLPQDTPRPFTGEPYCSISPVYYSRIKRCCCPDCSHPPEQTPPWLQRSSPPMFLEADKQSRSPCFSNHPYRFGYDRDYRLPGNSSLAARPKHQSSGISMAVSKRKKRHRTAFTPTQLLGLENSFEQNQYSVGEERKQLAEFLGLSETQIKVWFQNRRTKWKRIRKEAEEDDEEAKEEADRNHDNYRNYESCYPHCTTDRNEQPARVYPYERLWPFHQPLLGKDNRGPY